MFNTFIETAVWTLILVVATIPFWFTGHSDEPQDADDLAAETPEESLEDEAEEAEAEGEANPTPLPPGPAVNTTGATPVSPEAPVT